MMPVFLENFPQKLSVSTRFDLGDMVERVLTLMVTPLGSRDVRPPFFDDKLHVPKMFYSSPSPRSILLCVMCTYQLKPRPPTPGQGGDMWEIFMALKARPTREDGGFLRIRFAY